VIDRLDLVRQRVDLRDAHRQLRIELVGQPQPVRLDEEEEVLGALDACQLRRVQDLDLRQLLGEDLHLLVGVPSVLQHHLEAVVALASLPGLHLGRGRQERGVDPLTRLELHGYLLSSLCRAGQTKRPPDLSRWAAMLYCGCQGRPTETALTWPHTWRRCGAFSFAVLSIWTN